MITKSVESLVDEINDRLKTLIPSTRLPYNSLFEGARYTLSAPGKRIRPLLVIATAEMLGSSKEKALSSACAIEMIHTYSMIHDDLPCMDNDDFRRGRPTLHRVLSEGEALLVGNYLFTEAFLLIAEDPSLASEQKIKLITLLSKASGGEGMIGGQVMDLKVQKVDCDLGLLKTIHKHKTGALIEASVKLGAIIAEASKEQINKIAFFGEKLGLLYQIVDDLLDVTASVEKHGKKIGSDEKNNKATYVSLLGMEKTKRLAIDLSQETFCSLDEIEGETLILRSLTEKIVNRI